MDPSYNNSLGSAGAMQQPVASGTGDIVLSQEKGGGVKKWWIVGAIVGIVVVVVVVLLILFLSNNSRNTGKSASEYANDYLRSLTIGGSEGDFGSGNLELSKISSGDFENIYVIPRFYSSLNDKNVSYYNKLQELLNGIKNNSNDEEGLVFWADDSKTMLSYYFVASALAYTNSDYEYYLQNKNLDGLLSVYGYPFAETEDDMLLDFADTTDALYDSKKEFYNEVSKTNCVRDDGIDYACLDEVNSEQIEAIQKRSAALTSAEEIQAEKMLILIVADAKEIYNIVGGSND